jgi:hypothetical protein
MATMSTLLRFGADVLVADKRGMTVIMHAGRPPHGCGCPAWPPPSPAGACALFLLVLTP